MNSIFSDFFLCKQNLTVQNSPKKNVSGQSFGNRHWYLFVQSTQQIYNGKHHRYHNRHYSHLKDKDIHRIQKSASYTTAIFFDIRKSALFEGCHVFWMKISSVIAKIDYILPITKAILGLIIIFGLSYSLFEETVKKYIQPVITPNTEPAHQDNVYLFINI